MTRRFGDLHHLGRAPAASQRRGDQDWDPSHRRRMLAHTRTTRRIPIHGCSSRRCEADIARIHPAQGRGMHRSASRRRLGFLKVRGSVRALRPSRSRADVGAGRSSDFRAGAPGLLIDPAPIRGRRDNGKRGAEPLGTRLQRRDRSGFTPDSLFAGRRRPRRPATHTRSNRDETARASGCQMGKRDGVRSLVHQIRNDDPPEQEAAGSLGSGSHDTRVFSWISWISCSNLGSLIHFRGPVDR